MNIVVLNGSPKGEVSITMQYVAYIQKKYPEHAFSIIHISQRIKKLEADPKAFAAVIDQVRQADGVLWAFPLYFLLVHGNYKRFIELITERGVQPVFAGKPAAVLTTSIHYFDHIAHNYMRAICDDLGMNFTGTYSADMYDLEKPLERQRLLMFAGQMLAAMAHNRPAPRTYPPLAPRQFTYQPAPLERQVAQSGKRVVLVHDYRPGQENLGRMLAQVQQAFAEPIEVVNLQEVEIKGGCQGCLQCGYSNECVYTDKDGYIEFFNDQIKGADILIWAGSLVDRYLSARWKTFFDRSFFNTHTPVLEGKQLGFLISGPLSQNANLRQALEGYSQFQGAHLAGIVTDEFGSSAEIDQLILGLADNLVAFASAGYIAPPSFLGFGGMLVFREDIWGRLRAPFQADYRAYAQRGFFKFPQFDWKMAFQNWFIGLIFRVPRIRHEFQKRIKPGMISGLQAVVKQA